MAEALIASLVMVAWKDPQRSQHKDMITKETALMYANRTDPTKLPIVPYFLKKQRFKPKDYVAVDVITKTGSAGDIDTPESDVDIPITVKNLRTGVKYPATLYEGSGTFGMTMTDPTPTVDLVRKEWLYWQVPDGLEVCLGQEVAFNSRLLVCPVNDGT